MAPISQHFRKRRSSITESESEKKAKKCSKSLKYKLRGVQRLLRQKNLPASVRIAQERMLNMIRENLKENAKKQKEIRMTKKYKMVRCFEKRKLSRMYRSCINELKTCTEQKREELNNTLELLKQQWNYVVHFPKDERYIPLFPPTPCNSAETSKHKEHIFKMIKDKIDNREIKDASDGILHSPKDKKSKQHPKSNTIQLSSQQEMEEDGGDLPLGEDVVKKNLVDDGDLCIDTNASKEINQESSVTTSTNGAVAITNQSTNSTLGVASDKPTNKHKVKRLKSERDVADSKKKKKIKRKVTEESE